MVRYQQRTSRHWPQALLMTAIYEVLVNDETEIVISCRISSKPVRPVQARDIDANDSKPFGATRRTALSA